MQTQTGEKPELLIQPNIQLAHGEFSLWLRSSANLKTLLVGEQSPSRHSPTNMYYIEEPQTAGKTALPAVERWTQTTRSWSLWVSPSHYYLREAIPRWWHRVPTHTRFIKIPSRVSRWGFCVETSPISRTGREGTFELHVLRKAHKAT